MAQELKLPDLGEGIEGGDVVQVLVKEGDTILPQQPIVEIETDKAVLEVPSPFGGKITKIHVKAGDKAKVGTPLVTVETTEEPAAKAAPTKSKEEKAPAPPAPAPAEAVERTEAARAEEGDTAQPAKTPTRKAPAASQPKKESPAKAPPSRARAAASPAAARSAEQDEVPAGPATRRLARELGIDLADVAAMFPGERLSEEQIKAYIREGRGAPTTSAGPAEPPLPDFSQWGEVERVPLSSLAKKSGEHVKLAWISAPHVTHFDLADVTGLESLRKRYRDRGQTSEIKLTVTAFVLKAVAAALKEYPNFNASLDARTNELIIKHYYHIGVAVDTEAGLIVPVLRDVDQKGVLELAKELEDVSDRTRRRKISPDELRGGTFTITNLGGIGGTAFTPIINMPEVAILGLARSREEPVVERGQLSTRLMLPLCLSYDHRVVNGADGARFARKVAALLEDPELLLLEG